MDEGPLYCLPPLFQILSNSPTFPVASLPMLFLLSCFFGWIGDHVRCAVLLNIKYLYTSSLGTLVPKGPWHVFYAAKRHVHWDLTRNVVFAGPVTWYHTHKGASRLTHQYKYLHHRLCVHVWYLYYSESINRNSVNKQNIHTHKHTHTKQSEKVNTGKG